MDHQKSNNTAQGKLASPVQSQNPKQHPLDRYSPTSSKQEDDKSPYYKSQVPAIELPKGGGALKGIDEKFTVNAVNGTSSLNIPLPLTPGRNGFTPALSLQYNSGSGNSEFGLGWGLGLPAIQRKTDKKLPEYNDTAESDTFLLAGAEDLVPLLEQDGSDWKSEDFTSGVYVIKRYRPRIEGLFARIEFISKTGEEGSWWRVTSKENIVTYYGLTPAGRIADPNDSRRIFKWLPQLVVDNKGNVQQYEYQGEDLQQVPIAAHEHNHNNGRASFVNRYLKKVKYCNLQPYSIAEAELYEPVTLPSLLPGTYLMEAVFDYGDHGFAGDIQQEVNFDCDYPRPCRTNSQWPCRKDPFSDFHAGFEIRTYRRCRRVLMFHYFTELRNALNADNLDDKETLVRSLDFIYHHDGTADQYAEADFITKIIEKGYRRDSVLDLADVQDQTDDFYKDRYLRKATPALSFDYQALQWNTELKSVSGDHAENAPQGLTGPYQWIDLWGEGLPGILTEQGNGWFYKTNDGGGKFTPAIPVAPKPSVVGLGSSLQWQDLDADGRRQVVSQDPALPGYFELDDDQQWQPFKAFRQRINVDWKSPFTKLLDLNGDGRPDLLMTADSIWTWYQNRGTDGFEAGGQHYAWDDEENGPRLVLNDNVQTIFLADMNGDGMTDIVRIKNGEVCYWPNLGYGRFGRKVAMTNTPVFDHPELFNPSFIMLADISGTGAADIIYLGKNKCTAWINLSGNAWSNAYDINPLPAVDQYSQIAIMDFLGNGTGCIVWSSPLLQHAHAPLRYIDLMGGKKPFLMKAYSNGMGKTVSLTYRSSTGFYLDDRTLGTPWATRLPFPVQCVSEVKTTDAVSETCYKQSYTYHHGYYDHEEREFRGFGRVDSKDAEVAAIDNSNVLDQPPVLTKTWYHTGAWMREKNLLDGFAKEYFSSVSWTPPDLRLDLVSMTAQEIGEAHRALKGLMLRQEVYAQDGSAQENIPYTVTARSYWVRPVQPQKANRHSSFLTHDSDTVVWHCERNQTDPRILHDIVMSIDKYGNVLKSAKIAYKRGVLPEDIPGTSIGLEHSEAVEWAQGTTRIVFTENNYTNDSIELSPEKEYRLCMLAESKVYELHNIPDPAGTLFTKAEIERFYFGDGETEGWEDPAVEIDYATVPDEVNRQKRLLEHRRILYLDYSTAGEYDPDGTFAAMNLGKLGPLGLVYEQYTLAYTTGAGCILDVTPATGTDLTATGGYRREDAITRFGPDRSAAKYWLPGGTVQYAAVPAATFFTPVSFTNPWSSQTNLTWWGDYYLLPETVTDALGNTTMVKAYDFRCLQPAGIQDPNTNVTEILFDVLCVPIAMAVKGKVSGSSFEADELGILDPESSADITKQDAFWAAPGTEAGNLLGHATWRCIYNFDAAPLRVAMIARERHYADLEESPLQIRITYTDGLGRIAMHKAQAAPEGTTARWIGSGKTVYNNKGSVVMQYEPYYALSAEYDNAEQAAAAGVSPCIQYDPLGRIQRTDLPDGSYTKTEWDAWTQTQYDNNDTVTGSAWYVVQSAGDANQQNAAGKAAEHADTPTITLLDVLGQPFYTIQHNRYPVSGAWTSLYYQSAVKLDIQGNRLNITDARGNSALSWRYNMLKAVVTQVSVDSAVEYSLIAADGQPLYAWNDVSAADDSGRRFLVEYDALRRPVQKKVTVGAVTKVLEILEYGEDVASAATHNLRGKLYKHFDGAGVVTAADYDFIGNLLNSTRQFTDAATQLLHPDWTSIGSVDMEENDSAPVLYITATTYDALNRPVQLTTPDGAHTSHSYDGSGRLFSVAIDNVHGADMDGNVINAIYYNARGQRIRAEFDNGVATDYVYDPYTFRVTRIHTYKPKTGTATHVLQDINYWYDPVGNITFKRDDAQPTVFFNNSIAAPENDYTYDAVYRLIEAGGRQHQCTSSPEPADFDDSWRVGKTHTADGSKMLSYIQYYTYDPVGNMTKMKHTVTGATSLNWTRDMDYVDINSNKLLQSDVTAQMELYDYDARGNMVAGMSHILHMEYNDENRLEHIELQDGRHIYHQYDAGGQRVRKVMVNGSAAMRQTRKYVGGWEVYEEYNTGTSRVIIERETLHVMDDSSRIAMIDTPTVDERSYANPPYPEEQVIRYQFTDHLGTAALELNEDAEIISYEEYSPFGSTSFQSVNKSFTVSMKRYRYTGKERDEETGFYYHGARYYIPWLCRWSAADPLQYEMPGWSSYNYGFCNPITWQDSTGMSPDGGGSTPMLGSDGDGDGNGNGTRTSQQTTDHQQIHDSNNFKPPANPVQPADKTGHAHLFGPLAPVSNGEVRLPEPRVLMVDVTGKGYIGAEADVKLTVGLNNRKYNNAVAENIAGGIFGALGYMINGDKGSFVGAAVDNAAAAAVALQNNKPVSPLVQRYIPKTSQPLRPVENKPQNALSLRQAASANTNVNEIISTTLRVQKQSDLHTLGGKDLGGRSYLRNISDAKEVLNAAHSGQATILSTNVGENRVYIQFKGVTGYYNDRGIIIPTNKFLIKGAKSATVVPIHPNAKTFR